MQLRSHRNFKKATSNLTRFKREISFFCFSCVQNIFVLTTQIGALTTQLRIMRRKLKQKRCNFEVTEILKRHNFEFALDLNGKSPFSVLALYKHFRINDANRSTNDATSKHATQTETKTMQLRNHRNFKKTQLRSRRRTRRRNPSY